MTEPVLDIEDLSVTFQRHGAAVHAVRGVSLRVAPGEVIGIVGESGSGKSVTTLAAGRLLDPSAARINAARLRLDGHDILALGEPEMRRLRGPTIAYIFQDPMTSLNPVLTIGRQLSEGLRRHQGLDKHAARKEAIDLLRLVGISEPELRAGQYPHEASGGMRQRMMIAMALALRPKLLIADEPTTALDVTVQAEIVRLVQRIRSELGMAMIWVTHDLALLARLAARIIVMYGGRIVEDSRAADLYAAPSHPYTSGLLASTSRFDVSFAEQKAIPGAPPDPTEAGNACAFAPRCERATDRCRAEVPALAAAGDGRRVACFHPLGLPA